MTTLKSLLWLSLFLYPILGFSQKKEKTIVLTILNDGDVPLENAVVVLHALLPSNKTDQGKTDSRGRIIFLSPGQGTYRFTVTASGYKTLETRVYPAPFSFKNLTLTLRSENQNLQDVLVNGKKPLIEALEGKLIVHVDEMLSSNGSTVLELLEKSPGVSVDKSGGISLRGKANVMVMIDNKLTYLAGAELNNLLSSMSAGQVSQIELITNPSAKYDASGNAGIINIKTKKINQAGWSGSFSGILGWSRDSKISNVLQLNYKQEKYTVFASLGFSRNNTFTDIDASRSYFDQQRLVQSRLAQSTKIEYLTNYQFLRSGLDFYASKNTTIGFTLSGALIKRGGNSNALAQWQKPSGGLDSAIQTTSNSNFHLKNGAINLNLKHNISTSQELSIDLDALKYDINNNQEFVNHLLATDGYTEGTTALIPSILKIFSLKADYTLAIGKNDKLAAGVKSSSTRTDNMANYERFNALSRSADPSRSNHFLYRENINAGYFNFEHKQGKIHSEIGLRYENTYYRGAQQGNSLRADSTFSRNYNNLFPSGYISYAADSLNSFSITAGRRIDRPAFQKLNPFLFIVNKYTIQRGNPYILPQYSWNIELGHRYTQMLNTTISYSITKNYFSQLFLTDGDHTLIYTDGNVGQMQNLGLSVSLQLSPTQWWSFNLQNVLNHKKLKGYQNVDYRSSITQLQSTLNNQFRLNKTLSADLSANYMTRTRNDLQELLYPTGQIGAGLSQSLFKGMGSLKLSARDIFYTQAMEGLTDFPNAQEYFKLTRDSRTFSIGFTYRFGRPSKNARRPGGGAADEINRAGA